MTTKVYIEEAGCDRRQLDATTIRAYLEANGYTLVDDPRNADKLLVVTCAFKEKEEEESVLRLRSLLKYGRDIVVYGCLADIATERYEEFSDLPSVPPREIDHIEQYFAEGSVPFSAVPGANTVRHSKPTLTHIRRLAETEQHPVQETLRRAGRFGVEHLAAALNPKEEPFNLFVCRGCSGSCSYCAIRRAIGAVQSKPIGEVVTELRKGLHDGYRVFNILGDDPGCYGHDLSIGLPDLLGALFDETESWASQPSAEPNDHATVQFFIRDIHPENLIRYHGEMLNLSGISLVGGILCPIQSGSDRILETMRRRHTASQALEALQPFRQRFPGIELDTQIIVGFPGETEEDFRKTLGFVSLARFDSVVVFPYDDKEGTPSARLGGKIPPAEIDRRVREAFKYFRHSGIRAYASCPS